MNELEELMESLDLENNSYFYHITSKGFGNDILENGLYLKENDIRSTTIRIPKIMIENPEEYCKNEYSNGIVKRQEMVIIGCDKDEEDYLVSEASSWMGDEKFDYVIPSEYILGYIDLENLEVTYNESYEYGGRHV